MIEASLYTRLVSALSSDVGTRVYPCAVPRSMDGGAPVTPLAVYNTISKQVEHTITEGATNYIHTHVQVDVYALTYAKVKSMADTVRQSIGSWTVPKSVHIVDAGTDMIEDSVQPSLYRVSLQFNLDHISG